jgi:hypothetical protein
MIAALMIAALTVVLAVGSPAAAKCCSLGGGGSSNFLGDPAVDISMSSYDEFVRENVARVSASASDVKSAATSRMSLNLRDNGSMDLLLFAAEGSLSGRGNITWADETKPVEAVGMLQASQLYLNVTALGGDIYKFSLASEGSTVIGDYSKILPDGKRINETAKGKWVI